MIYIGIEEDVYTTYKKKNNTKDIELTPYALYTQNQHK